MIERPAGILGVNYQAAMELYADSIEKENKELIDDNMYLKSDNDTKKAWIDSMSDYNAELIDENEKMSILITEISMTGSINDIENMISEYKGE